MNWQPGRVQKEPQVMSVFLLAGDSEGGKLWMMK